MARIAWGAASTPLDFSFSQSDTWRLVNDAQAGRFSFLSPPPPPPKKKRRLKKEAQVPFVFPLLHNTRKVTSQKQRPRKCCIARLARITNLILDPRVGSRCFKVVSVWLPLKPLCKGRHSMSHQFDRVQFSWLPWSAWFPEMAVQEEIDSHRVSSMRTGAEVVSVQQWRPRTTNPKATGYLLHNQNARVCVCVWCVCVCVRACACACAWFVRLSKRKTPSHPAHGLSSIWEDRFGGNQVAFCLWLGALHSGSEQTFLETPSYPNGFSGSFCHLL